MKSSTPVFPIRWMVRQIRKMYRPSLIRPAHAYFYPVGLRPLPRRLRLFSPPNEEGDQLSMPVTDLSEHSRLSL
ncbi:MAG: hypothetical protein AB1457_16715 [Chloroflexota bacterium]|nr:MAG: hypothetical protein KatS3mg045_0039 [Bellilinea sp.]